MISFFHLSFMRRLYPFLALGMLSACASTQPMDVSQAEPDLQSEIEAINNMPLLLPRDGFIDPSVDIYIQGEEENTEGLVLTSDSLKSDMDEPLTPLPSDSGPSPQINLKEPVGIATGDPSVTIYPLGDYVPGLSTTTPQTAERPASQPVLATNRKTVVGDQSALDLTALPADNIYKVYFDHGSFDLSDKDSMLIQEIADASNGQIIVVEGHASKRNAAADDIRADIINLDISLDRAFSVASALIAAGANPDNIRTLGWGDHKADQAAGEIESRRVDIKLYND